MDESDTYIVFGTQVGNEDLLKEEVKLRFKDWKIGYSSKGVLTYKITPKDKDLLAKYNFSFALFMGIFKEKLEIKDLNSNGNSIFFDRLSGEFKSGPEGFNSKTVLINSNDNIYLVAEILDVPQLEYLRKIIQSKTVSENFIARAYLKIQDAFTFCPDLEKLEKKLAIELGSAPGGISQFLLEKGYRLESIDPAQMDPILLKNNKFRHINKSVQDVSPDDMKIQTPSLIVNDMNLHLDISFYQTLKFIEAFKIPTRYIFCILKVPNIKQVGELQKVIGVANAKGLKIQRRYFPSFKRETLLFIKC